MKEHYDVVVIGGGISGAVASVALTNAGVDHVVLEGSKQRPEPHLHYFHRDDSNFFKQPFQKVDIHKALFWNGEFINEFSVEMHNYFSWVTTDKLFNNSSKYVGRYNDGWIPKDGWKEFYKKLYSQIPIYLGARVKNVFPNEGWIELDGGTTATYKKIIFTIPLPFMLGLVGRFLPHKDDFRHEPLVVDSADIPESLCDPSVHQVIYIPKADFGMARISLLSNRIVAERANEKFRSSHQSKALHDFINRWLPMINSHELIWSTGTNPMGRYIGVNESFRSTIIHELEELGIHPLGRYAQWTYKRVDHTIDDIHSMTKRML